MLFRHAHVGINSRILNVDERSIFKIMKKSKGILSSIEAEQYLEKVSREIQGKRMWHLWYEPRLPAVENWRYLIKESLQ